jgi:hypothetical protein
MSGNEDHHVEPDKSSSKAKYYIFSLISGTRSKIMMMAMMTMGHEYI